MSHLPSATEVAPVEFGPVEFGPLRIAWDHRVLEPRPWTAAQSRWAAELATSVPAGPVLELCTGAGHIGLLTARLSGRALVCVDASSVACDFATRNAHTAGLADRVQVRHGLLETALGPDERFPLVVADPPWVRSQHVGDFPQDPLLAIDGGPDGLSVARACLEVAATHLVPGGALVLQVGTVEQAQALAHHDRRLRLVAVRQEERGVLAHFTTAPGADADGVR